MRARWLLSAAAVLTSCWGGAVPQAPECASWVACQRARDVRDGWPAADLLRYEVDGFCWNNSELAKGCTTSCERGLERIRARDPVVLSECAP
jgi:hypothetical protein